MAPEKAPAFQFYPADFLMDGNVQRMTLEERGGYITLLCLCWQERMLPKDDRGLARMLGVSLDRYRKLWPAIERCFQPTDDGWTHKRLEKERTKQADFRRRQSDAGKASAANRKATEQQPEGNRGSTGRRPERQPKPNSSISDLQSSKREREKEPSLSPRDPFTDPEITERAGRFTERYQLLYQQHRKGARYALKPHRDYAAAVTLCQTWTDDARLEKLAVCFLKTDHKFAEEGSRTIPQFLALASWCDGKLAEWETKPT